MSLSFFAEVERVSAMGIRGPRRLRKRTVSVLMLKESSKPILTLSTAETDAGLTDDAGREKEGAREGRREVKVELMTCESADPRRAKR